MEKVRFVAAAIEGAGSLEQAKAAVLNIYGELPRGDAMRVLEAALTLAELAGAYSAQEP